MNTGSSRGRCSRGADNIFWALDVRSSISHLKHNFVELHSCDPTNISMRWYWKHYTSKNIARTGSSSRELNRSQNIWAKNCNPYRGMTLCSLNSINKLQAPRSTSVKRAGRGTELYDFFLDSCLQPWNLRRDCRPIELITNTQISLKLSRLA